MMGAKYGSGRVGDGLARSGAVMQGMALKAHNHVKVAVGPKTLVRKGLGW